MISLAKRAEIRRLFFGEHWKMGTIAAQLGVHRDTVKRAVDAHTFVNFPFRDAVTLLDPYLEFVRATLEQYPRLRATRLLQMLTDRGYKGSIWTLRRVLRELRPATREAFFRLTVMPGEQAQVDWGSFGAITIGRSRRSLSCFVMVLSWSRAIFACFVLDQTVESFLRCHVGAFDEFGGVPRAILYDNLKAVVLERIDDVIRFNPRILELAGHYHFAPRPVGKARGNEKGRVERAIRYIRDSFFAARSFASLEDLNRQLRKWIGDIALARIVELNDEKISVRDALMRERERLLPLPEHSFKCELVVAIASGKTPYLRFDANDYSIPHDLTRRPLTVVASDACIRVLDGDKEVALHSRCWEKGRQIEAPHHLEALAHQKRNAREHAGRNRLTAACPHATPFLESVAIHGGHLGGTTSRLLRLLDQYGASEVDNALSEAQTRGAFAAQSVAHILDQARRANNNKAQIPIPVVLPNDPRVRDLVIRQRPLSTYDRLADASIAESGDE